MNRRAWVVGLVLVVLAGCGSNPIFPPGTEYHLNARHGDLVPVVVPDDQESWGKGRRTWLPDGTPVVGVAPAGPGASPPSNALSSRVAVVGGPHAGAEVLVDRSYLALGSNDRPDRERLNLRVLGVVLAITLIGLAWEGCQSWLAATAAHPRRAVSTGLGARSGPFPFQQDDARWLAWLRVQNARQRHRR